MNRPEGFRMASGGETIAYRRVLAEIGGSAAAGVF